MRVIIAGSRDFHNYDLMCETIESLGWNITTVISGTAGGADRLGERWAADKGVPVERYPADWDRYGKSAGYKRNVQMSLVADALIAFSVNNSRGTAHMIAIAQERGLKVHAVYLET